MNLQRIELPTDRKNFCFKTFIWFCIIRIAKFKRIKVLLFDGLLLLVLAIPLVIIGCSGPSSPSDQRNTQSKVPVLDIDLPAKKTDERYKANTMSQVIPNSINVYSDIKLIKNKLSDFADSLFCIPLETNSKCVIGGVITDVFMTDEFIFIVEPKSIKKFSKIGKFICSIGRSGKGPGEFPEIGSISIDRKKKEIYIYPHFRKSVVIIYDFDGKLIKETPINERYQKVFVLSDGCFAAQMESFSKFSPGYKKLTLIDSLGRIMKSWDSGIFPKSPTQRIYMYGNVVDPMFTHDDKMLLWEEYSDTIHMVKNNELVSAFTIEPNKMKIPFNEYYYKKYNPKNSYRQISDICFFGNNLMFKLNDKGSPALVFFNIKTEELCKAECNEDSQGTFRNYPFLYTLENDFLGGVFYPQFEICQGYNAMILTYTDILQNKFIDELRKADNSHQMIKIQFINLFEKLDITSNPVLVVAKTKN